MLIYSTGVETKKIDYKKESADFSIPINLSANLAGNRAFANNQLTDITIPNSVRAIGKEAFAGNDIDRITIGANVRVSQNAIFRTWKYWDGLSHQPKHDDLGYVY